MLPMHTSRLVSDLVKIQHGKTRSKFDMIKQIYKIYSKFIHVWKRISHKLHLHDHRRVSDLV